MTSEGNEQGGEVSIFSGLARRVKNSKSRQYLPLSAMVSRRAPSNNANTVAATKRRGSKTGSRAIDDDHGDWTSFRPGIVCGGRLSADQVAARSKGATEACLKALKSSSVYESWERGEDLAAPAAGSLVAPLKKALIVVLVVLVAVSTSIYREKLSVTDKGDPRVPRPAAEPVLDGDAGEVADVGAAVAALASIRDHVVTNNLVVIESPTDAAAEGMPATVPASVAVPPEEVNLELRQQLEDLQLEVKLQTSRATQAKEKENAMFEALEASTRKVHDLSRDLRSSQRQVELLTGEVELTVGSRETIRSVDRTLLGLEILLVLSSMVGFVRSHKIRTSMLKARRSFALAYRRHQRVLASADEVYAAAMRYNAEVEAADVGPRAASVAGGERGLNPWDPLLDDLESLVKSNLTDRVGRGATPVQILQALAVHFAELKRGAVEMEESVEKTRTALESSTAKVRFLEGEVDAAKKAAEQGTKALQEESGKTKQLSSSLASAEAKACGLEDQVRAALEEKEALSDELLKAKEELEKVTAYAESLEKAGFADQGIDGGAVAVRDHLRVFSDLMDAAAGPRDRDGGEHGDGIGTADSVPGTDDEHSIDEEILGQRLQRIKSLIQEANDRPFELLSPNTSAYDGTDAGSALQSLPVIGAMNISSSDSEDEDHSARKDASAQRMLDTSVLLSNQVAEYLDILEGEGTADVVQDLRNKRDAVDTQRKHVEALVHASQKEARACGALKAKRKEVDFLSEKEEILHGEDELRASDRLFFARKKEKDAMLELQDGQSALRAALERARQEVRASR